MKIKSKLLILAIILLFLSIILPLFPYAGYFGDMTTQQNWGNIALEKGLPALYLDGVTDYAPLYLYVLKLNAWFQHSLFGNINAGQSSYVIISKIIPTLANLLMGIFLFLYFRKKDSKTAIFAMAIYLLNLAVIYNTAYWGQVDSVNTLLMFLSILFLLKKRYIPSTIFLTLATLTKIQSSVLIPVILAVLLKNVNIKELVKISVINIAAIFAVLLPYIFGGAFGKVLQVMLNSMGRWPHVTANAYNLWYLTSPRIPDEWLSGLNDAYKFYGISLKTIGLCLLLVYTLLVVYQLCKNAGKDRIVWAASGMTFAFFMLPTQIHERYLFPFFALFSLLAFKNKRYLGLYLLLSLAFLLNLMIVLPFRGTDHIIFYPFQYILNLLIEKFSLIHVAIAISIVNIMAFVYFNKIGIFQGFFSNTKRDFSKLKHLLLNYKKHIF